MSELKLYAFQPDGHGPASFFVMASSEENARVAINQYIEEENRKYELEEEYYNQLTDYEISYLATCKPNVLNENEVIMNDND